MNPNIYSPPLADTQVDDISQKDGLLETMPLLSLNLKDEYIIHNLHNRIQESHDYWNQKTGFNLKERRVKAMRMIKGEQIEENALYHYQTPFKDNELYVGIDAIIAYITSSIAGPQVYPAGKEAEDRLLAKNLLGYFGCYAQEFELDAELETCALNLLGQYFACLKLEWDADYGEQGEIITRAVNPMHLIVDKHVRRGANPSFICETLKDTVEGLVAKFPDKEEAILKIFNIERKRTKNMTAELAYREVWFTYFDNKHKAQEAVCWYVNNLVLDKRKSPNWLYKGEGENFLKTPMKPYIPFNLFNDGNHWVDFTGPVEQAIPVQEILNKEGRQIIDNLATANGFRIVLAGAMTDDALENLTGDPNQSVIVTAKAGQKIDDVYKQIEPHLVSAELIADKNDNRDVIHSILGTPSQFRGDDDDQTKTASEAQLIKNQATGRQDKIVRAFNRGMGRYYRMLAQMIAVWYTDTHSLTADGGDGAFDFFEMHQDKIKKGMTVKVWAEPSGDKMRKQNVAQNAAELKFLAPIDYYKAMDMENPQKLYDNLVKFNSNPQQLAMDVANDEQDGDAIQDFAALMKGQKVEQRKDITPEYLEQLRQQMISDDFLDPKKTSKKIRKGVIAFAQRAMVNLAIRTELDEASDAPLPPEPLPPELQATLPPPPPPQQPMMPQPGQPMGQPPMPGQPPMGMPPGQPMASPMGQPAMPSMPPQGIASPPGLAPNPMGGTPLPAVGIQNVLQTARSTAPNLDPNAQPSPELDLAGLTPR